MAKPENDMTERRGRKSSGAGKREGIGFGVSIGGMKTTHRDLTINTGNVEYHEKAPGTKYPEPFDIGSKEAKEQKEAYG